MDDQILVVNAGSSTLKMSLLATGREAPVKAVTIDAWDGRDTDVIEAFVHDQRVDVVGHRVVHGGTDFTQATVVDDAAVAGIAELIPLAPLHQPRALAGIAAARAALPSVASVACFDTAFHSALPAAAATYAIPQAWRERWPVRRFGFHGLSHRWAAHRAAELLDQPVSALATVVCHLGAGASLCAVQGGVSVDTTMGFTPLEGLVMGTRSGTVDPGLVLWLIRNGLTIDEVGDGLEHTGGLLALAGTADMREVLALRSRGEPRAVEAFDVYVHRLAREAAGMVAALGRLDALVFTGGVGEHAGAVRAAVAERLEFLGIRLDPDPVGGDAVTGDLVVSPPGAAVATLVVESREDLEIVRQVRGLLGPRPSTGAP